MLTFSGSGTEQRKVAPKEEAPGPSRKRKYGELTRELSKAAKPRPNDVEAVEGSAAGKEAALPEVQSLDPESALRYFKYNLCSLYSGDPNTGHFNS